MPCQRKLLRANHKNEFFLDNSIQFLYITNMAVSSVDSSQARPVAQPDSQPVSQPVSQPSPATVPDRPAEATGTASAGRVDTYA